MSSEVRKCKENASSALVSALKTCARRKDLLNGSRIHADVLKKGLLQRDIYLGNALVSLYAKCDALVKAREVFDQLQARDVVSWTVLMAGYTQGGSAEESLNCFARMQTESLTPDAFTLVCILKVCSNLGAPDMGKRIHAVIILGHLLVSDIFIGTALLDMYAKCGAPTKAHEVFDQLENRNVISWNALLSGYAQKGDGYRTLHLCEEMQYEGISPDAATFVCVLKACASVRAIDVGLRVHDAIIRKGTVDENILVTNALIGMYVKCSALAEANEAFGQLSVRNVVTWSTLIAGYVENGDGERAYSLFQHMQSDGIVPDEVSFVCILKACGNIGAADRGQAIHKEIKRMGVIVDNISVGNALVDMYAKCGDLDKAREVFDQLSNPNGISWSIIIAGYVQHENGKEALDCFAGMRRQGFSADVVTCVSVLKACGNIRALRDGFEIHTEIVREDFLAKDISLGIAIVDMYAKCGALQEVQKVFSELELQNIVSWSTLIAGYAENEHSKKALECSKRLQQEGLSPDAVTFVCVLKACGNIGEVKKGIELHVEIKEQLLDEHVMVGNALLDMYSKCGCLEEAKKVFDKFALRNVISWNTLIAGYVQHGQTVDALYCFDQMHGEGFSPNVITYACALKACGSIGAIEKGIQIHSDVVREGFLQSDDDIGNALVDMYIKCCRLMEAQELFDDLPVQNVVTWNSLLSGFYEHGREDEAMDCFNKMQCSGVLPDGVTFVSILGACGSSSSCNKGKEIHARIATGGPPEYDFLIGNALVSMYAKCGMPEKAHEVFNQVSGRDTSSWTALITGYSRIRRDDTVVDLFDRMIREGVKPDMLTFTVLLNACNHLALLDRGLEYFGSMITDFAIVPSIEHYACMIDLFGRAGQFDKAITLIQRIPTTINYLPVWSSVLGACQKWGNLELGILAFETMVRLAETHAAGYVSMRNIYAVSSAMVASAKQREDQFSL